MTVPGNIDALLLGGQRGYQIERSLRFNSADSAYLVNSSTRTTTVGAYTFSFWVKRCALGGLETIWSSDDAAGASNEFVTGLFSTDNKFYWYHYTGNDPDAAQSNGVLRDTAAWYHIVFSKPASAVGTLYINGVAQTKQTSYTADADAFSNAKYIGSRYNGTRYSNCYLTEFYGIDGQALTPSSFGETDTITGVWKPKRYSGTYGTNGFYLKFADNSGTTSTTLGKDSSGNGNNWTPNNFSVTAGAGNDSLIDTPTPYADGGNGRANYPTWNPLTNGNVSVSNGSLDCTYASAAWQNIRSTMAMPASGKWYAEITQNSAATYWSVGICNGSFPNSYYGGQDANSWAWQNGNKFNNGSPTGYGSAGVSGDVFMIAVNRATNSIWLGKNGTWFSGDPAAGTTPMYSNLDASGDLFFMAAMYAGAAHIANFGQRAFSYTPPAGFSALNTQNLPEPSIKKPSTYFEATAYSGTAGSQAIAGLGFSPDLVWIKRRNSTNSHVLQDAVRGAGKTLFSNATNAESGNSGDLITSFDSAGFTVNDTYLGGSGGGGTNASGGTYVAWCWDESATPGFDIVTFNSGAAGNKTQAHSLGVAPAMIITKSRDSSTFNWAVWHQSFANPAQGYMALNTNNAVANDSRQWANTAPTSTVFSYESGYTFTANQNIVAYLWSEVAGFSKFGSYVSNNSTDGPFVYCGFRPKWVLCKDRDRNAMTWIQHDSARSPYNVATNSLAPSSASAEPYDTASPIDILSNGFKLRGGSSSYNNYLTDTYIFAAFAESPFKYSLAR